MAVERIELASMRRRAFNLVYQAGGLLINDSGMSSATVIDNDQLPTPGQGNPSPPVSSNETPSQSSSVQNPSDSQAAQSSVQIPSARQGSHAAPSLDTSAQQAAQVSFLVSPSSLFTPQQSLVTVTQSAPLPTQSSSSPLTSTISTISASSSSTNEMSSSSASTTVHSESTVSVSSTAPSTSFGIVQTAPLTVPTAHSTLAAPGIHSTEFYIGVAFLGIVAIACIAAFLAWVIRSRKSGPGCCCTKSTAEDDDLEKRDLGFGLGFYLDHKEKDSISSPVFDKSGIGILHDVPLYDEKNIKEQTALPSKAYFGSVESFAPTLGPLHIKNLMPGDVLRSGSGMSREGSPFASQNLGTPREEFPGSTPRFLGLGGQGGLELPWARNAKLKSASPPNPVNVRRSPLHRSMLVTKEGAGSNWDSLSPLPLPHFDGHAEQNTSGQEGWGSSLRSGFLYALTAVTGGQSAKNSPAIDSDRFTTMPSRPSKLNNAFSDNNALASTHRLHFQSNGQTDPMDVGPRGNILPPASRFAEDGVIADTPPLVIRKKTRALGAQHDSLPAPPRMPGTLSRTSSKYFPSATTPEMPELDLPPSFTRRGVSMPVKSKIPRPVQPPFLERAPSSRFSVSTFQSESSQASKALTDEELQVRDVLKARASRVRASALGSRRRGSVDSVDTASGLSITRPGYF